MRMNSINFITLYFVASSPGYLLFNTFETRPLSNPKRFAMLDIEMFFFFNCIL